MINSKEQAIQFMTKGFLIVFFTGFVALVITSDEPFKNENGTQEVASIENNQLRGNI